MGFETVVRPAVFPSIRPAPAQPLPAADNPDEGFAVIRGQGGKQINLPNSYSKSASSSVRSETKRRVDEVRVYQKDAAGKVNKENFIDLEVVNKVWLKGPSGSGLKYAYQEVTAPDAGSPLGVDLYRRAQEADNIKILRKDIIKSSDDE